MPELSRGLSCAAADEVWGMAAEVYSPSGARALSRLAHPHLTPALTSPTRDSHRPGDCPRRSGPKPDPRVLFPGSPQQSSAATGATRTEKAGRAGHSSPGAG